VASTSHASETVIVYAWTGVHLNGSDTSVLLDVGIGAASSETVLVPNLQFGGLASTYGHMYAVPISVASGSRISARLQGTQTSETISVALGLRAAGDHSAAPTTCTTYGANTATSQGVNLGATGANNVKGSWVEITSSTTADMSRMLVGIGIGSPTNAAGVTGFIDIGVGGAGAETVVAADIPYELSNQEFLRLFPAYPFGVSIPSGSRISARYATNFASALSAPSITVYGLD
jgi:hypothetical protein